MTEDNFALSECFTHDRDKCPFKDRCAYTSALGRALEAFQAVLAEYTIADLAANPDLEAALNIIPLHRGQKRVR
jgi:Rrf2 family iron-responsive transcriptional regulator